MAVAEVPFDLVEVKLAAPQARPGTTAKGAVIERLSGSQVPCVSVVAPAGGCGTAAHTMAPLVSPSDRPAAPARAAVTLEASAGGSWSSPKTARER